MKEYIVYYYNPNEIPLDILQTTYDSIKQSFNEIPVICLPITYYLDSMSNDQLIEIRSNIDQLLAIKRDSR